MSNNLHGDKTWQIKCWANGQTIDRKEAAERVVRVLKSFGHNEKDIDSEVVQRIIAALPYLGTTPSVISEVQRRSKLGS